MRAVSAILAIACVFCAVLGPVVFMPMPAAHSETASIMTLNVCDTSHGAVPVMGEIPCMMTEAFTFKPAEIATNAVPEGTRFMPPAIASDIDRPPQA